MNMNRDQRSHLFVVRLWSDEVSDRREWSGRIQHVLSGEAYTFYDWPTLIDLLLEMAETERIETKGDGSKPKEAIQ